MDEIEIEKRIAHITNKLEKLKLSLEKYDVAIKKEIEDEQYIIMRAIERDSEEIIESATRINQELLSDLGIIGETYRDSFEQLTKLKIFDGDKLEKLANLVGFRNRLAHDYLDLDEFVTRKSAKNILRYYPQYLLKIQEYVENKENTDND